MRSSGNHTAVDLAAQASLGSMGRVKTFHKDLYSGLNNNAATAAAALENWGPEFNNKMSKVSSKQAGSRYKLSKLL